VENARPKIIGYDLGYFVKEVICATKNITGLNLNCGIKSKCDGDESLLVADAKNVAQNWGVS
jgi:UDP-glucose 4-epimerase